MSNKAIIHTSHAPEAIGPYSQAVKVGNTVFLSGQIPLDPKTMQLVQGTVEQEATRVRIDGESAGSEGVDRKRGGPDHIDENAACGERKPDGQVPAHPLPMMLLVREEHREHDDRCVVCGEEDVSRAYVEIGRGMKRAGE